MASGRDRELPVLRITYDQLVRRSRVIAGECRPHRQFESVIPAERRNAAGLDLLEEDKPQQKSHERKRSIEGGRKASETLQTDNTRGLLQIKPTIAVPEENPTQSVDSRERKPQHEVERRRKSDSHREPYTFATKGWKEDGRTRGDVQRRRDSEEKTRGMIQVDQSVLAEASKKRRGSKPLKPRPQNEATGSYDNNLKKRSSSIDGSGRRSSTQEQQGKGKMVLDPEVASLLMDIKRREGQVQSVLSRWSGDPAEFDRITHIW